MLLDDIAVGVASIRYDKFESSGDPSHFFKFRPSLYADPVFSDKAHIFSPYSNITLRLVSRNKPLAALSLCQIVCKFCTVQCAIRQKSVIFWAKRTSQFCLNF